jgi:hypothetical protein
MAKVVCASFWRHNRKTNKLISDRQLSHTSSASYAEDRYRDAFKFDRALRQNKFKKKIVGGASWVDFVSSKTGSCSRKRIATDRVEQMEFVSCRPTHKSSGCVVWCFPTVFAPRRVVPRVPFIQTSAKTTTTGGANIDNGLMASREKNQDDPDRLSSSAPHRRTAMVCFARDHGLFGFFTFIYCLWRLYNWQYTITDYKRFSFKALNLHSF